MKTRALSALACIGLLATFAGAVDLSSNGTIGTEFSVTFDADVGSKPKIELRFNDPTKKAKTPKAKAKLVSSNGTNVTFVIQAAKGGGSFTVGAKKSDATAGSITLAAPRIDSVGSATVAAGGTLTIQGQYFGELANKRAAPKVFVNGKKAKVTAFSDTALTITIHKKTASGLADIVVQNKVGEGTSAGAVTVTAPPTPIKGADTLSAKIGGKKLSVKFTKKTPEAVIAVFGGALRSLQISTTKASGSTRNKRIELLTISFDTGVTDLSNLTLPATFTNVGLVIYQSSILKISGGIPPKVTDTTTIWDNTSGNPPFSVTIDNVSGDRISGSFSGTLNRSVGPGAATIQVVDGKFVTKVN